MTDDNSRVGMSFEEMILVVSAAVDRFPGVRQHVTLYKRFGEIMLTREENSNRWAKIEIGSEVFFLDVDQGFLMVDFAWIAEEQTALLEQFTEAAYQYLHGNFSRSVTKSPCRRKRQILKIHLADGEQLFLKPKKERPANEDV